MRKLLIILLLPLTIINSATQNAYADLKNKISRYNVAIVYFYNGTANNTDTALLKQVVQANKYRRLNIGILPIDLQSSSHAGLSKTYNFNRPAIVLFIKGAPVFSQEGYQVNLQAPFDKQKIQAFLDTYIITTVPQKLKRQRCTTQEIDCAYDAERAEYKEWQRKNAYIDWFRSLGLEKSPWGWQSGLPLWYSYNPSLLGPGNRFITVEGVTIA